MLARPHERFVVPRHGHWDEAYGDGAGFCYAEELVEGMKQRGRRGEGPFLAIEGCEGGAKCGGRTEIGDGEWRRWWVWVRRVWEEWGRRENMGVDLLKSWWFYSFTIWGTTKFLLSSNHVCLCDSLNSVIHTYASISRVQSVDEVSVNIKSWFMMQ